MTSYRRARRITHRVNSSRIRSTTSEYTAEATLLFPSALRWAPSLEYSPSNNPDSSDVAPYRSTSRIRLSAQYDLMRPFSSLIFGTTGFWWTIEMRVQATGSIPSSLALE
jgi:hypothetical protein